MSCTPTPPRPPFSPIHLQTILGENRIDEICLIGCGGTIQSTQLPSPRLLSYTPNPHHACPPPPSNPSVPPSPHCVYSATDRYSHHTCPPPLLPPPPRLLSYRPLPPPRLPNRLAFIQLQTVTSAQLPYVYSAKDRYSHHACPNPLRLLSYRPLLPPRLPNHLAFIQLQTVTPPRLPLRLFSYRPLPHHACPTVLRLPSCRELRRYRPTPACH